MFTEAWILVNHLNLSEMSKAMKLGTRSQCRLISCLKWHETRFYLTKSTAMETNRLGLPFKMQASRKCLYHNYFCAMEYSI